MLISVNCSQHHHHIDHSAKTLSCSALLLFHQEPLSHDQPCFHAYSMHEDHPQKKKRWRLLKRSNPNHNLSDESGSRTDNGSEVWNVTIPLLVCFSQVSTSLQTSLHSSSRTESSTRSPGLLRKLLGKDTKKSSSGESAQQSLNSASPTPESRVQDLSAQTGHVGEILILDMAVHVMISAAGAFNTYCSRTPPKPWPGC